MRQSDIHILQFLRNEGNEPLISSPSIIAANIDFEPSTVRERVGVLRDCCLIEYENENAGYYRLSELGMDFLTGNLSDSEADKVERRLSG